jgi:hypothetical protein
MSVLITSVAFGVYQNFAIRGHRVYWDPLQYRKDIRGIRVSLYAWCSIRIPEESNDLCLRVAVCQLRPCRISLIRTYGSHMYSTATIRSVATADPSKTSTQRISSGGDWVASPLDVVQLAIVLWVYSLFD